MEQGEQNEAGIKVHVMNHFL